MFWRLVYNFAKRELKTRYAGTALGYFWIIFYPLMFTLVSSVVFSLVFSDSIKGVPYFLYVWLGTSVWIYFSQGVVYATRSLANNREVVVNVMFEWSAIVVARVMVSLIDFLINLLLFLIVFLVSGNSLSVSFFVLPVLVVAQTAFVMAIGFFTSVLNIYFRDVQNFIDVCLQLMYFLTPVVYPLTIIPEKFKWLVELNPVTQLVSAYRTVFFGGDLYIVRLIILLLFSLLLFVFGRIFFVRYKYRLPELM